MVQVYVEGLLQAKQTVAKLMEAVHVVACLNVTIVPLAQRHIVSVMEAEGDVHLYNALMANALQVSTCFTYDS
jgi:hypothetical protein